MATARGRAKSKAAAAEAKAAAAEMNENLAAFSLPESLPCSEVSFPVLIQKRHRANWKAILQETEHRKQEIQQYEDSKVEQIAKSPFQYTECDYVKNDIFLVLLPAIEETLNKAKLWGALQNQRCFFNGIDWIAQVDYYVKNDIFVVLLPAIEETLNKAKLWGALQNQRCFFNGIDWIAQVD
ncbi:hypothetical protein NE865_02533 [Phthorimaea operculella]|nr:hypothetical protein NE865_02533 [Phthorimaea operculella]